MWYPLLYRGKCSYLTQHTNWSRYYSYPVFASRNVISGPAVPAEAEADDPHLDADRRHAVCVNAAAKCHIHAAAIAEKQMCLKGANFAHIK